MAGRSDRWLVGRLAAASASGGAGAAVPRVLGSCHRTTATTANETALSRNAAVSPDSAMRTPPIAGPMMNARLSRLAQALLAGPSRDSSPTRLGRNAPIVGPKNDEKQVARIASATIGQIGPSSPPKATSAAIASMIAPRTRSVTSRTSRRS